MRTVPFAFLVAGALGALACGGTTNDLVELECECEHCNDYEEDLLQIYYDAEADLAENYGCSAQWEAWATCVQDKSTCNETEARFTTSQPGSCTGRQDIGISCSSNTECESFGDGAFCDNGSCAYRVCAGDGGQFCETNDDCFGEDLCQVARAAVGECIDAASINFDYDIDID